jgi:hypothetical protein
MRLLAVGHFAICYASSMHLLVGSSANFSVGCVISRLRKLATKSFLNNDFTTLEPELLYNFTYTAISSFK